MYYPGLSHDVTIAVEYLNELGEKTMRSELYAIADLLLKTEAEAKHYREKYNTELNESLDHSKRMVGNILTALINKAA
jgi:hypothetical protein